MYSGPVQNARQELPVRFVLALSHMYVRTMSAHLSTHNSTAYVVHGRSATVDGLHSEMSRNIYKPPTLELYRSCSELTRHPRINSSMSSMGCRQLPIDASGHIVDHCHWTLGCSGTLRLAFDPKTGIRAITTSQAK